MRSWIHFYIFQFLLGCSICPISSEFRYCIIAIPRLLPHTYVFGSCLWLHDSIFLQYCSGLLYNRWKNLIVAPSGPMPRSALIFALVQFQFQTYCIWPSNMQYSVCICPCVYQLNGCGILKIESIKLISTTPNKRLCIFSLCVFASGLITDTWGQISAEPPVKPIYTQGGKMITSQADQNQLIHVHNFLYQLHEAI